MTLIDLKLSRLTVTWSRLVFLPVLVYSGGGDAAPLSAKFKVHGLPTIRAGEMTFLNCFLEEIYTGAVARPPSYVWVKDGKVIPGQTESIIRFPNATRQDAGFYQCGVPGSDVSGEGRHLHVVVPGEILPKPNVEFRDIPVCGRPYSLHCIIMQKYIPSDDTRYTWYKDHAEVSDQPCQTLTFTNVTEADTGEYTCTAREGPVETTSPPSDAFYLRPLVIPQVSIEPNSTDSVVKGFLGGNLNLTCKVTWAFPWVPSDGYSWRYFSSTNNEQRPLGERTNTLTLGPLTREDSGQYVCQARNDQGLVNLHLIGYASVTVDVVYLESIALTPDLEVSEGDPVTLACSVDSHPTASLEWMVNGQEVRHVTYNVDHYVIPSAACSDSNNYTCRASNTDMPGLERNATVQLHVICKQAPTEPHTTTTVFPTELQPEQSDPSHWMTATFTLVGLVTVIFIVVTRVIVLRKLSSGKHLSKWPGHLRRCLAGILPAAGREKHRKRSEPKNTFSERAYLEPGTTADPTSPLLSSRSVTEPSAPENLLSETADVEPGTTADLTSPLLGSSFVIEMCRAGHQSPACSLISQNKRFTPKQNHIKAKPETV